MSQPAALCCPSQMLLCPALSDTERSLVLQSSEKLVRGCIHGTTERRDNWKETISVLSWINDSENCPNSCVRYWGYLQAAKGSVPNADTISTVQASTSREFPKAQLYFKHGGQQPNSHVWGRKVLMCRWAHLPTLPVTCRAQCCTVPEPKGESCMLHDVLARDSLLPLFDVLCIWPSAQLQHRMQINGETSGGS